MPNTIQVLPLGTPSPEATYRAYALQPGREILLSEGITNQKGECRLEYEWSGGKALHLQVRAYAFDDAPLGASEVVYNAKAQEQIRFSVSVPAPPKEFEGIRGVLRYILPEGYSLVPNDIELLMKSLEALNGEIPKKSRDLVTKTRLETMLHSRDLAAASGLPESICYAISRVSRKKWTASALLAEPDAALGNWINKAVAENIIDTPEEPVLPLFESARHTLGLVAWQECFGNLRGKTSGQPLFGYTVHLRDADNNRELGYDTTNRLGRFAMRFSTRNPKFVKKSGAGCRLELSILSPESEATHQEIITIRPGQQDYGDIRVPEPSAVVRKALPSNLPKNSVVPAFLAKYLSNEPGGASKRSLEVPESQSWKAATSPRAYLADLLDYAIKHLRQISGGGSPAAVTVADLSALLHQPFDALLLSGELAEQPVRQIRLSMEGMRRLLGNRPLKDATKEISLKSAEVEWRRTAYDSLLVQLGVSVEVMSNLDTADEATRKSLSTRLGFTQDKLVEFYQPDASMTEAWLEQTFGLIDTSRDGLSTGVKLGDIKNQLSRWQLGGMRWNETTDAEGKVYLRLSKPDPNTYLAEVFKDAIHSELLASGSIASAQGTIILHPFSDSGVGGFFEMNYADGGTAISIAVVPKLLAYRCQFARQRWQALYQADDPKGIQFLEELYQNAQSTLENAVEKTEISGLLALRDALAAARGQDLRHLSERLLLDCEFDASFTTTRTAQAITTLQQLLGGLRNGLQQDTFPNLQFQIPEFDEEWTWLGTYENWRSALLVFLYPENLLDPTLRRWQTPVFQAIVDKLRTDRQLTEKPVNNAVAAYEGYFRSVCSLAVEATCHTVEGAYYQFARANGAAYWSSYGLPNDTGLTQLPWEKIPGFEKYFITRIIGAVPFKQGNGVRQIYVCCMVVPAPRDVMENEPIVNYSKKLAFTTYNPDTGTWADQITLPAPLSTAHYFPYDDHIVVEQRLSEEERPHFVVFQPELGIYSRRLNADGTDWEETNWHKINYTPTSIKAIHALVFAGAERRLFVKNSNNKSYILSFKLSLSEDTSTPFWQLDIGGEIAGIVQDTDTTMWRFVVMNGQMKYGLVTIVDIDTISVKPLTNAPIGIANIPVHCGIREEIVPGSQLGSLAKAFRLSYTNTSGQNGQFHALFVKLGNNILERRSPIRLSPNEVSHFDLKPGIPVSERRQKIAAAFSANADAPAEVILYLWEAYYFLPVYIAQQWQRSHQYAKAFDYFRLVYDYGLPAADRKVFYGLTLEENQLISYERAEAWLLDPLNPHSIAATRRQAYTRYMLLALTRCFLQAADAEFTQDTVESLASARTYYVAALELLESSEFQQEQANWGLLFTVPRNPAPDMLRFYAELSLYKLHTGRNIAGDEREAPLLDNETVSIDELNGMNGGQPVIIPAANVQRPTPFRFALLIERAKQLVGMAQQMEAAFLSALEKLDAEQLQLLNAKNELQTAKASIRLQDLRVKEAKDGVKLAELQGKKSIYIRDYYQGLISTGWLESEETSFDFLIAAAALHASSAILYGSSALVGALTFGIFGNKDHGANAASALATAASTTSSVWQMYASFERRQQEWEFQLGFANQDIRISNQQIRLSQDQAQIVNHEHTIATLRSDQANSVVNFLATKFTNADLYDFMSDVLEGVYSFFLQQATATAQLAAQQLAFERQEPVPAVVLTDYWVSPSVQSNGTTEHPDRRGITGSARLLQDIQRLDQIAFQTDQRKLQLSKTVSLAQMSPAEFQRFRKTGVFPFHLPLEAFDSDFPGHYLRLIRQVRVSVIALIPPIEGIRATLTNNGISRVVLPDSGRFTETVIRRPPESIAFTSPLNANGLFELQADNGKLLPFESMGVDGFWELQLPKAANAFDYNSIADVLLTVEYTALNNADYRRQVVANLDRSFSGDRAFSFRREFPDQWYDFNHAEQSSDPMIVQFDTLRGDFPVNLDGLKLKQVVLYFVRKDGFQKEMRLRYLRFEPNAGVLLGGSTDQNLETVDGVLSTRTGSIPEWDAFRGETPVGSWRLALADTPEMRQWFREEQIADILFVLTIEGETPAWPE